MTRIEYSPQLSKFMQEAEAVGGWYLTVGGSVRTRRRQMDLIACPVAAVYGYVNYRDAFHNKIVEAADNFNLADPLTAQLRKDMEGWVQ
jgi:hypothetical protein